MLKQNPRMLATIFVLMVMFGAVFGFRYFQGRRVEQSLVEQKAEARVKGNSDAIVKIVEFIDFHCPACARGAQMLKQFMAENPGLVFLEMKYFPLGNPHGFLAAQYAQCAARQGQFWSMHDMLLEKQQQWFPLTDVHPAFEMYAGKIGLDPARLTACLKDESVSAEVIAARSEGQALGVRSTPTYFINGEMIVGFRNLEERLLLLKKKHSTE